jgi:hypothetical protein
MPAKHPIDVEFKGLMPTEWIETDIRRRAAKLDTFCRDILHCRIIVDRPHRHRQSGNRFQVRIEVTVRGGEISISHESNLHSPAKGRGDREWAKDLEIEGMRKDVQIVIHEAFDVAKRRLQHYVLRHRSDVKRNRRRPLGSRKNEVQEPS